KSYAETHRFPPLDPRSRPLEGAASAGAPAVTYPPSEQLMTTALAIVALCVFIFGAYAYGSLVVLSLRHGSLVWSRARGRPLGAHLQGLAMLVACTVWFVLHTIIQF